ncbi:flavin reductase [Pseudomonas cuatrocienegasensis]|uniref:FMN reductase (NADH) RutF n=1 Tax=Pseudomonas cuatrocienegasensis TaxID=543360 RepID=A0ABY1B6D3_9PSED|nr:MULTISPECIES: pyrimidine utilization flavin reductase protein F [Pseudomonas]OEC36803.1 pyrimidine utilization flavin reductase protein F [Pseudomonas sp. 21C1]SEQ07088.1 flavin reductase [Pseudomonas cuatrocienegasensis]
MLTSMLQPTPATPPLAKQDYRDAMARLGAAVNIITTDGPGGRAGFTASAVCSVTDEPPTLLVCLNRSASVHDAFVRNRVLCVNVLAHGQEALSNLFGGKTAMAERFAAADWLHGASGSPVLQGALVSFDCQVVDSGQVGSHDVLYAEVIGLHHGQASAGLMYFQRAYHRLGE